MRKLELNRHKNILPNTSFADTIRRNHLSEQYKLSQDLSQKIVGGIVEDGCWIEDQLAVLLSANCALHFFVLNQEVKWSLIAVAKYIIFKATWHSDPEVIRLTRYCNDGRVLSNEMDRKKIMADIIGKEIKLVTIDQFGVYLHFRELRQYLALHAQFVTQDHSPFLEWFEDDD
jgi:hypothetical protein